MGHVTLHCIAQVLDDSRDQTSRDLSTISYRPTSKGRQIHNIKPF